jgi:hypothetical protein
MFFLPDMNNFFSMLFCSLAGLLSFFRLSTNSSISISSISIISSSSSSSSSSSIDDDGRSTVISSIRFLDDSFLSNDGSVVSIEI